MTAQLSAATACRLFRAGNATIRQLASGVVQVTDHAGRAFSVPLSRDVDALLRAITQGGDHPVTILHGEFPLDLVDPIETGGRRPKEALGRADLVLRLDGSVAAVDRRTGFAVNVPLTGDVRAILMATLEERGELATVIRTRS